MNHFLLTVGRDVAGILGPLRVQPGRRCRPAIPIGLSAAPKPRHAALLRDGFLKAAPMRRAIAVAAFATLLTACGPPSVEDFIEDPDMLGEAMEECQMEAAQGKPKSERCRNADKAVRTMGANLIKDAGSRFMEGIMESMEDQR